MCVGCVGVETVEFVCAVVRNNRKCRGGNIVTTIEHCVVGKFHTVPAVCSGGSSVVAYYCKGVADECIGGYEYEVGTVVCACLVVCCRRLVETSVGVLYYPIIVALCVQCNTGVACACRNGEVMLVVAHTFVCKVAAGFVLEVVFSVFLYGCSPNVVVVAFLQGGCEAYCVAVLVEVAVEECSVLVGVGIYVVVVTHDGASLAEAFVPRISGVKGGGCLHGCACAVCTYGVESACYFLVIGEYVEFREGVEDGATVCGIHGEAYFAVCNLACYQVAEIVEYRLAGGKATAYGGDGVPLIAVVRAFDGYFCGAVVVVLATFLKVKTKAFYCLAEVGLQIVATCAYCAAVTAMKECCVFSIDEVGVCVAALLACRCGVVTDKLSVAGYACACILYKAIKALQAVYVHIVVGCDSLGE